MDIENELLNEYKEYITKKSKYSPLILPNTPQSFSTFPTIIFKEADNIEDVNSKSTNYQEYANLLTYQIEIYSKNKGAISSRTITKELEFLTYDFFRNVGFKRIASTKGEYIDITIDRYIMIFNAYQNSWNLKLR